MIAKGILFVYLFYFKKEGALKGLNLQEREWKLEAIGSMADHMFPSSQKPFDKRLGQEERREPKKCLHPCKRDRWDHKSE